MLRIMSIGPVNSAALARSSGSPPYLECRPEGCSYGGPLRLRSSSAHSLAHPIEPALTGWWQGFFVELGAGLLIIGITVITIMCDPARNSSKTMAR